MPESKAVSTAIEATRQSNTRVLYAAIAVAMALILLADWFTPLGIAVWVVYIIPVSLTLLAWRSEVPLVVAVLSTFLMVVTFITDESGIYRNIALMNRAFGILTVWGIAGVSYFFIKAKVAIDLERWLQQAQTGLSRRIAGDQRIDQLGESILQYLSHYLDAQVGACFTREGHLFRRVATYGVPSGEGTPEEFTLEEGLLGQAAKDRRYFTLIDVPDGYLKIGSALGESKPRHLVIFPIAADDEVLGVIELGFWNELHERTTVMLERVSESLGVAIRSANYRAHLQSLLEETQRQTEELQAQSEELRVANEELEEQGLALKETASRLEQQQAELEQTNTQLEEQTQLLEHQRDDLAMTKLSLQRQAKELEQASRYKSDFLANMSHELRTPLNSSLILAKLLADNPDGNLTEEQVNFAKTILTSGNDLLNLISDILDLSKIEAGQMDVRPEDVRLRKLTDELARGMLPLAQQKSLKFEVDLAEKCPPVIFTDQQRLEQILKNLLSNAIKFTDEGEVVLTVAPAEKDRVKFTVKDTGVGIAPEYQKSVFEAFRQADGTTSRRHGGTGLGLSISRELAHLLGGEIHLESEVGRGSIFTVTIPKNYDPSLVDSTDRHLPPSAPAEPVAANLAPELSSRRDEKPASLPSTAPRQMEDDRDNLMEGYRVLLVVEDDVPFAQILYDLAHELHFQCLVAHTAEEAVELALHYRPSAVVLDVGLPDHSGLSVLDRLKNDPRVRHIPVHVISADDYTETVLSLGAVGFMRKPVDRDQLAEVLQGFEVRFSKGMRRVLVVEDDPVQLQSLQALLDSDEVQTVGASNATECLDLLKSETFDCMVLDLTLPDASGYALLETLSREEIYSFPPVIIYTGRELTADQEQQLRRYSKSIIIKGAKSPERLLDEVTLFLHQVVSELPPEQQRMIEKARRRDAALEGRRILVVEDDVRNIFALTSVLEPHGAIVQIARNGQEAVDAVKKAAHDPTAKIDLVLMDVMMPVMDGITATREIRKLPEAKRLSIIMLTAKAMKDDQQTCLAAGANDFLAKPLDVEKLLSLIRVWLPR